MIDSEFWHVCRICNYELKPGGGVYKNQEFEKHLLEKHKITYTDYFVDICGFDRQFCSCGICNKELKVIRDGSKLRFEKMSCGRYTGTMEWSKKAKDTRKGDGNPMFGKTAWNDGLTKETSESMKIVSEKMTGRSISDETKKKQSESSKKRLINGHTGHKHSEETKEKGRQRTLQMIKDGKFKQIDTKPFREFVKILEECGIEYEKEKIVECWSFDIYLPNQNVYIEIDGDYWHTNPKVFPNGPKTKTQKINWYRDIKKNKFCEDRNLALFRFWELDILNNPEMIKNAIRENSWC